MPLPPVVTPGMATSPGLLMDSENSREFSQDSEATPGESVVSSDEKPDDTAQSREMKRIQVMAAPRHSAQTLIPCLLTHNVKDFRRFGEVVRIEEIDH